MGRRQHQVPRELAELALAHAIKGSAEAAYWRDDALERRRPMMEVWGRFCIPAKAAICGRIDPPGNLARQGGHTNGMAMSALEPCDEARLSRHPHRSALKAISAKVDGHLWLILAAHPKSGGYNGRIARCVKVVSCLDGGPLHRPQMAVPAERFADR